MTTPDDNPPEALPVALFAREDERDDTEFYREPRLVTHIDDSTIAALTEFYRTFLPDGADLLDLMSSWISHLPEDCSYGRVAGLGMNAQELASNPRLTEAVVQDLNRDPRLPYDDASFDRAMIVVSVQYLTQPVDVMRELARVLRTHGALCVAMSHRLFPTKAIRGFRELSAEERIQLVRIYLDRAGFANSTFINASPASGDPLWLVTATL